MEFPQGAAGHGLKYHASKILAHQATNEWMRQQNPHFTLVTLHPSFVLGQSLIQDSASGISGINALLWDSLQSDKPHFPPTIVDVRDVAEAHIKAITALTDKQTTEILLSGPKTVWDEIATFIKARFPEIEVSWKPPFGRGPEVETSRADQVLGMRWRSAEEVLSSLFTQQLDLRRSA